MSLKEVLASALVDTGLDNIFKSSAGPSTIVTAKSQKIAPNSRKRNAENKLDAQIQKRNRVSEKEASEATIVDREKHHDGKGKARQTEPDEENEIEEDEITSGDSDGISVVPEHESLKGSAKGSKRPKKAKYVPEGETQEQRDARTIFIGNLPVGVVKSKPLKKQLKRHIISHAPSAKVESIRFRSVAFSNPTTSLADEDDKKPSRQQRQQKRAAEWRAEHFEAADQRSSASKRGKEEAEEDKKGEKRFMTPAEKRRLAAIKGELHVHDSATTNAYVVFAHPRPSSSGAEQADGAKVEVMDPFTAAREAVRSLHGTLFADHVIRVDLAGKPLPDNAQNLDPVLGTMTDPRLSIFVGNLDFASSEDDVWAFFEKIMREERGDSNEEDVDIGMAAKKRSWVTRVRVVRDRETQLGKGFAYVQFVDRDCVDEALSLDAEKLKFAKRTLRVQRCKMPTALAAAKSKTSQQSVKVASQTSHVKAHSRPKTSPKSLPKGDPTLGTRLAGLPKEERKSVKATDLARVARRLAKKKARMTLEKSEKTKNRVRGRKDKRSRGAINKGRKEKKKRERSERNLQKKNLKK